MNKIAIVIGTRPEIVKMAPVIHECMKRKLNYLLVHSGQHYDYEMDKVVFERFHLPDPHYNLKVGSGRHGQVTGAIMHGLEEVLIANDVDGVLVHGDTTTTAAGALVAAKLNIAIGHVEAGLRSYDRTMPEEINRKVADHISTHLFAPTEEAVRHLAEEGLRNGVYFVGQTAADALRYLRPELMRSEIFQRLGIADGERYIFLTAHRQENTDDRERFEQIVDGLDRVAKATGHRFVCPLHPRTESKLQTYRMTERFYRIPGMTVIPPVDPIESLALQSRAALVLTDSGGLQEEACMLDVPCVTIRENTERPETVLVGANKLAGYSAQGILDAVMSMLEVERGWEQPYGDGHASERIIDLFVG